MQMNSIVSHDCLLILTMPLILTTPLILTVSCYVCTTVNKALIFRSVQCSLSSIFTAQAVFKFQVAVKVCWC